MAVLISDTGLLVLFWVLVTFLTVVVGFRIWIVFHYERGHTTTADYLIYLSLLLFMSWTASATFLVVKQSDQMATLKFLKVSFAAGVIFMPAIYAVKASLLALYLQVARNLQLSFWRRCLLYGSIVYVAVCLITNELLQIFACWPVARNWSLTESHCGPGGLLWTNVVSFYLFISTDLLVMSVPLSFLFQMDLSRRYWSAIAMIVVVGALSVTATVVRFSSVMQILGALEEPGTASKAFLTSTFWGTIELSAGMLAASLPGYRTYVKRKLGLGTKYGSDNSREHGKKIPLGTKDSELGDTLPLARISQGDSHRSFSKVSETSYKGRTTAPEELVVGL